MINIDVLLKAAEFIEQNELKFNEINDQLSNNNNPISSIASLSLNSNSTLSNGPSQEKITNINKNDKSIHNTLEKNRRAHLKECFENLQNELPQYKDKKATNLAILNYTLKYVEQSQKKIHESELEKERLLNRQGYLKQRLKKLINELDLENIDYKSLFKDTTFLDNFDDYINDSCQNTDYEKNGHADQNLHEQYVVRNTTTLNGNTLSKPKYPTVQRKRSSYSLTVTNGNYFDNELNKELVDSCDGKKIKLAKKLKNSSYGRIRNYSVDEYSMSKKTSPTSEDLDNFNELSNEYDGCTTEDDYDDSVNDNESSSHEFRTNRINQILVKPESNINNDCIVSLPIGNEQIVKNKMLVNGHYEKQSENLVKNESLIDVNGITILTLDRRQQPQPAPLSQTQNGINKILSDDYRMYMNSTFNEERLKDSHLNAHAHIVHYQLLADIVSDPIINSSTNQSSSK